jgi:hypothetical protein
MLAISHVAAMLTRVNLDWLKYGANCDDQRQPPFRMRQPRRRRAEEAVLGFPGVEDTIAVSGPNVGRTPRARQLRAHLLLIVRFYWAGGMAPQTAFCPCTASSATQSTKRSPLAMLPRTLCARRGGADQDTP